MRTTGAGRRMTAKINSSITAIGQRLTDEYGSVEEGKTGELGRSYIESDASEKDKSHTKRTNQVIND